MCTRRKIRKWKVYQILMGLVMLAICGFILYMASTGVTVEDRDATPVLLFGPLGLYLLFTKERVIN